MSKYTVTYPNGVKVQEEVLTLSSDNKPIFNGKPFGEFGLIANSITDEKQPINNNPPFANEAKISTIQSILNQLNSNN